MNDVPQVTRDAVTHALRSAGARFALLHDSRMFGAARSDSDVDVAAWWGSGAPASFEVDLPPGVDLVVLDSAPLELRGRIAQHGVAASTHDGERRGGAEGLQTPAYLSC